MWGGFFILDQMTFNNKILILLALLIQVSVQAQIKPDTTLFQKYYKLGKQEEVFVPLGRIAFADTVVKFKKGKPAAREPFNDPSNGLGEPDYTTYATKDPKYVSIGCGGQYTVKFKKVGFIDIEGPDLFFFEVGPTIEPFKVEISTDGKKWFQLGRQVNGGQTTVDIGRFIRKTDPPQIFHYIRLTDLKRACGGVTPGADMDAIGAIGAVIKLSLDAKVLFDYDRYNIQETARNPLDELVGYLQEIPKAKIQIHGHTDGDGSKQYNKILGRNRAESVRNYIQTNLNGTGDFTYDIESFGKSKPVKDNHTKQGMQQNRRVEIIVFPDKDFYKPPEK